MKNKPASLLVVPLGKTLSGIPRSWCGRQMAGYSSASSYNALIAFSRQEDKYASKYKCKFTIEISASPCDPNPCLNGGTCFLSDDPENPTCVCSNEFTGPRCEIRGMCSGFTINNYLNLANKQVNNETVG